MREDIPATIGKLPYNILNQLPTLVANSKAFANTLLAQQLGPGAAAFLGPLATASIDAFLDNISGTADTDRRLSERVGVSLNDAMRKRDRNRFLELVKKSKIRDKSVQSAAIADHRAILASIYGEDAADVLKDSVGSKLLSSINAAARKDAYNAGIGGVMDGTLAGAMVYAGTDASGNATYRTFNPLVETVDGKTVRKGFADAGDARFLDRLGTRVMDWTLGRATGEGSITGSLSNDEVRKIVADYAKSGGFSGKDEEKNFKGLEDQLRRIADSVNNIKDVMGDSVTAAQAMQMVSTIAGSAVTNNAQALQQVSERFRNMARNTDITEREWYAGTALAMQQLSPFGVSQAVASGVGLNIAGVSAGHRNRTIGLSDSEDARMLASLMTRATKTGADRNRATLRLALSDMGAAMTEEEMASLGNFEDAGAAIRMLASKLGVDEKKAANIFNNVAHSQRVQRELVSGKDSAAITAATARKSLSSINEAMAAKGAEIFGKEEWSRIQNKVLNGRDITEFDTAALEDLLTGAYKGNLDMMTKVHAFNSAYARQQIPLGHTVDQLRSAARAGEMDRSRPNERTARYRTGADGVMQLINSRKGQRVTAGEIASVFLTGTTTSVGANDKATKALNDELDKLGFSAEEKARIKEAGEDAVKAYLKSAKLDSYEAGTDEQKKTMDELRKGQELAQRMAIIKKRKNGSKLLEEVKNKVDAPDVAGAAAETRAQQSAENSAAANSMTAVEKSVNEIREELRELGKGGKTVKLDAEDMQKLAELIVQEQMKIRQGNNAG